MGQKFRELGFKGTWIEAAEIETSLEYGARIISDLMAATDDATQALLGYNGGGDPNYPVRFFKALDDGEANYLLL